MQETQQNSQKQLWRDAAERGLLSGAAAGLTSTIALMISGKLSRDHTAAALNGPSQWLWGHPEAFQPRATLRHTAPGVAIHHLSAIWWGILHERTFGARSRHYSVARQLVNAAATTAVAYFIDYHATPLRLRPGFRKHLNDRAIFAVYASFGLGLFAAAMARRECITLHRLFARRPALPAIEEHRIS